MALLNGHVVCYTTLSLQVCSVRPIYALDCLQTSRQVTPIARVALGLSMTNVDLDHTLEGFQMDYMMSSGRATTVNAT